MGLEWAGWLVVHSTIEVDSALSAFQVDGSTLASWDDNFFLSSIKFLPTHDLTCGWRFKGSDEWYIGEGGNRCMYERTDIMYFRCMASLYTHAS
jgi:hypothetical protein